MRIVLHCGQPKTGTSTLQATLAENRALLRSYGVCYPSGVYQPSMSHKWIVPLFLHEAHWSAHVAQDGTRRRTSAELIKRGQVAWDSIRREVERQRPNLLVLSSENYYAMNTAEEARALRRLLGEISDDVTFCLYLRNPADRYQSAVRQVIKSRGYFKPPSPLRARGFLDAVEEGFGTRAELRVYDRETLVGNDIVEDFGHAYLPAGVPLDRLTRVPRNHSLSTEATSILLAYRDALYADGAGFTHPRAKALQRALEQVDRSVPRTSRESLTPGLRERILRASTELDWLHDEYCLAFPGVQYPVSHGEPVDFSDYSRLEDVCELDDARRALVLNLMIDRLLNLKWTERAMESVRSRVSVSSATSTARRIVGSSRSRIRGRRSDSE